MKWTFGALGHPLRVGKRVRLRREWFGGIAFAANTGTTVDVDRAVFVVLDNLRQRGAQGEDALMRQLCGGRNGTDELTKARQLLNQLLDLAILAPAAGAEMKPSAGVETVAADAAKRPDVSWPSGPHLTAPVTVHWAVIGDIQDLIGHTAGGAPFASREEIANWIGAEHGESDSDFPQWLRRPFEE
jgi:hypothetical protein